MKKFALFCLIPVWIGAQSQVVWPAPPDTAKIILQEILEHPVPAPKSTSWISRFTHFIRTKPIPDFVRPMGLDAFGPWLGVADPGAGGVFLINREAGVARFISTDNEDGAPVDLALGPEGVTVVLSPRPILRFYDWKGNALATLNLEDDLGRLTGIAYYRDRFYVVDTKRHQIAILSPEGRLLRKFGERGLEEGFWNYPTFIDVSTDGTLYITDTMNFRVQRLSPDAKWLGQYGQPGVGAGQLNRPKGVAVDRTGRVYIVDGSFDNVQIFDTQGQFLMHFGVAGHLGGELMMPTDIAIVEPWIYVSDTMNNRIQCFRMLYE
ncbi:MAG: hypothetical protein ACE5D1_05420 [Fidelibacterota bacterium]